MSLPQDVQDALNRQIGNEFYAAHLYLSMAAWFDSHDMPGFAHWFRIQSAEENAHALRIFDYFLRRRGDVILQGIDQPPHEFGSALEAVSAAFEHEQLVTEKIHDLYALASQAGDRATMVEMEWFITEQVEEEGSAELLVKKTRLAGDNGAALLILDDQMARRAAPAAEGAGGG